MKRTILAGALLAGALAALPAGAAVGAAVTQCTGILSNTTINGPLEVPSGAGCALDGVHVNGSVKIDPGAALSIGVSNGLNPSIISGSVTGTAIQAFDSFGPASTIGGGLSLTGVTNVPMNGPLAPLDPSSLGVDNFNFLDSLHVSGATSISKGAAAAPWTDANAPTFNGTFSYTNNGGELDLTDGSSFGAGVSLHGNTGGGTLDSITVSGSLLCGNAPAFSVGSLTVSGYNAARGGSC
jgi:hypothetical protein